jgi:hypothetical protein
VTDEFKDHFSTQSDAYAAYRPTYPAELFEWLATRCRHRALAWDCATGNGQAADGLARFFDRVVATDASAAQIDQARPIPKVEFRVAEAKSSGLEPGSVDLITVAQAMHWIDRPTFYAEARRVARERAVIAIWSYGLLRIDPVVDPVVDEFAYGLLGAYWPPERVHVDQGYRTIEFPFAEFDPPGFVMTAEWTFAQFLGFLNSWSSVAEYRKSQGADPIALVRPELIRVWSEPERPRRIEWPLTVRAGLVHGS